MGLRCELLRPTSGQLINQKLGRVTIWAQEHSLQNIHSLFSESLEDTVRLVALVSVFDDRERVEPVGDVCRWRCE